MQGMDFAGYNQPLRLTYSLHSKTMMESIQSCQRRLCYTDVQLISEGGVVFAHSIVLAASSTFLKQLLITNPDPVIVIHLPGVDYEPLRLLLEVLYGGEELQLNLKQVVALQNLGSLLHIDMCNSAAMEQAFLQASQEGVLAIPGSLQQQQQNLASDTVLYSNESSPVATPQPPPVAEPVVTRKSRSSASPSKGNQNQNHNNNNNNNNIVKKRKAVSQSPAPMAPFSLLSNMGTPTRAGKRGLEDDIEDSLDLGAEVPPQPPAGYQHKKPSRAAAKEMVTCRECHMPFKLIMQLNQHMVREGHLFPPCPECSTPFTTLELLMAHADSHSSDTVFTCKYCQKGVLGHDRYLYHMLMCKSLIRGDYVCFICRKAFRNSGSLKTHLLLHTGAKPFPCNYCSASFRQRHHRSHHERSVHLMQGFADNVDQSVVEGADVATPTTPAVATAAATASNTSQNAIVDGSRPFPCGFCNAAFRQSNHRSYHERVIHGVDRRTRPPKGGAAATPARPDSSPPSSTTSNGALPAVSITASGAKSAAAAKGTGSKAALAAVAAATAAVTTASNGYTVIEAGDDEEMEDDAEEVEEMDADAWEEDLPSVCGAEEEEEVDDADDVEDVDEGSDEASVADTKAD